LAQVDVSAAFGGGIEQNVKDAVKNNATGVPLTGGYTTDDYTNALSQSITTTLSSKETMQTLINQSYLNNMNMHLFEASIGTLKISQLNTLDLHAKIANKVCDSIKDKLN
jgi:hypothetical protein